MTIWIFCSKINLESCARRVSNNCNKKEQASEELHRTIWNMANDLRGNVDGWDFKQYVSGMLFYRYISENFARYVNAGDIVFEIELVKQVEG